MCVINRYYIDKKGVRRVMKKYYVEFRDHNGIIRRFSAFTNKTASEELEKLIKEIVCNKYLTMPLDLMQSKKINNLPENILNKLCEYGIIEDVFVKKNSSINSLIKGWKKEMENKNNSKLYIANSISWINNSAEKYKWVNTRNIDSSDVLDEIKEMMDSDKAGSTIIHYIQACKGFCKFLVREKYMFVNPLDDIKTSGLKGRIKFRRRPYTLDELKPLFSEIPEESFIGKMSGLERMLLYRFACGTGIRWSEIYYLEKAAFDFNENNVTIPAVIAKNKAKATVPFHPELSNQLKMYMENFSFTSRAFPTMPRYGGGKMVKSDLAAFGFSSIDERGDIADFHSFRHTLATQLLKSGAPLTHVQKIMRHKDVRHTAEIYNHVLLQDKIDTINMLPEIFYTIPASYPLIKSA